MQRLSKSLVLSLAILLVAASSATCSGIIREVVPLEHDGNKLYLECVRTEKGGEPLLFVHGITYSSHQFDVDYKDYSLAKFFAANGFNVYLLDLTGYGRSEAIDDGLMTDTDYAVDDVLEAVKVILEREGRKSLNLLGWNWGTVIAGKFTADNPELVRRLVLYAPIVAGLGEADVDDEFHHNTWINAVDDFQKNQDGSINYDTVEPEVVNALVSSCWKYDKESSPNGGRRDLLVDTEERLIPTDEIPVPVQIIVGTKDSYVSPELCREAFGTLTNKESRLEIIDGAAHAIMMEKPYYKTFREKVLDFLKSN